MSHRILVLLGILLFGGVPAAELTAQERQITGRITAAESGQPLPGVAIQVRGTSIVAFSNDEGVFQLRAPQRNVVLIVQSIGYRRAEVNVPVGQPAVTIELVVDALALEEMVVTGAVTAQSRQVLANAIATVSDAELDRAPAETIERSLQGKVAGAVIDGNSGAPGGGLQVRLRGVSTINAISEPLYVVDGVVISNVAIPSNQNAVTRASAGSNASQTQDALVNRVVDLNPEEVESVEILKGASASAIYGSRASNGVVIITTKRGRPGAPRFNLSQRFGVFDLSNTLGSRTFASRQEAVAAFGEDLVPAGFTGGAPFDLEEQLAHRNDLSYETSLSVSGGNEDTRYYAAGLWKNDEGIIDNTGFEKQSLRLNLQQRLGSRFNLDVNTNLLHTVAERGLTNNDNSGTSFYMSLVFTPNFVDLRRRADGTFPSNPFERSNPLETSAMMRNTEDVWRFIGGGSLTFDAYSDEQHYLRFVANGGVDYFSQENELFFPPELQFEPLDGQPGTSLLGNASNLNGNLGLNAVHTFRADAGWTATTSAGFQYVDRDLEIARIESRNLTGGQEQVDAGTSVSVFENRSRVKDQGAYLQEEVLLLDSRLLVTAGVTADRSSANGDPSQFFFYPKAAASYRFIEVAPWLDHLKLRAAWGQSGNQPLFGQKFNPLDASQNIGGLPGLVVQGIAGDPGIEPERQSEIETGFDATLFDASASLEVTWYQKNISNLLLQRTRAPSTGFPTEFFNGGAMRTRGIEVALAASPLRRGPVSWITRGTFYRDRSEVTELPVPSFRTGGFGTALGAFEIAEGESATQIVAVVSEGDSSFVAKVGDANPDFKVGWVNDFTVGPVNLYFLFDWQKGGNLINLTKLLNDFGQITADYADDPQYVANIGPVEVDDTLTRGERRLAGFGVETRPFIEDASYVKLRELAIGYTLPRSLTSRLAGGIESMRVNLIGRNLLTFTDYTGLDPEVSNFGNQPIARNIDVSPFPPSRSFWLSVDVTF